MKRRSLDYRNRTAWRQLVAGWYFPAVKLNNSATEPKERKKPQKRSRWKDRITGAVIGVRDAEKIVSDRYALCPHTIGALGIDIDTVPGMTKTEFRLQSKRICQKQLNGFVDNEMLPACPGLKDKIIHREWSESGKGVHILFWQPDTELHTGRTFEPYGECFNGDNYIIPSSPRNLLRDLNLNRDREPLTEDEIKYLCPSVQETRAKKPEPIVNSAVKKSIIARPGKKHVPKQIDFISLFRSEFGEARCRVRLSDKIDDEGNDIYNWSLYDIGVQLNKIPVSKWKSREFRRNLRFALKNITRVRSNSQLILSAFILALSATGNDHCRPREKWNQSPPAGKLITMGKICVYANTIKPDFKAIDEWIKERLEYCEGSSVWMSELYADFDVHGTSYVKNNSFSQYFNKKYDEYKEKNPETRSVFFYIISTLRVSNLTPSIERHRPQNKFRFSNMRLKP